MPCFRQSLLDAGVEVNNAITLWQTSKKRVELDKKQILNLQASVWNITSERFDEIHAVINLYQALGSGY